MLGTMKAKADEVNNIMNSNRATASIDDNPCWGGPEPTRHDLEYLLRVLGSTTDSNNICEHPSHRDHDNTVVQTNHTFSSPEEYAALIQRVHETLIIYQDENYIAIHKPADLRMDGPHRATVHKLLLYLFPPPSLQEITASSNEVITTKSYGEPIIMKKHKQLIQSIAPLSNHSCLKDDPFRMVHQLDYATSGVLLLGKTRKATAAACRSFEERKTNKQYVAVVINSPTSSSNNDDDTKKNNCPSPAPPLGPDFFASLPTLPSSSLNSTWGDGSLEKRYRKKRKKEMDDREGGKKKGTFDGYMPVHSVFDKWRASLIREKKSREEATQQRSEQIMNVEMSKQDEVDDTKRKKKKKLPDLPSPKVTLTSQDIDVLLSLGSSWKIVKNSMKKKCATDTAGNSGEEKNWIDIVETMTREYNQLLADYYAKNKFSHNNNQESNDSATEKKHHDDAAVINNLPPLFRIQQNDDGGCSSGDIIKKEGQNIKSESRRSQEDSSDNTFYICASIGEPKDGRFQVIVDPSAVLTKDNTNNNAASVAEDSATPLPELRPSLTKCTVLWRGFMNNGNNDDDGNINNCSSGKRIPVAKVLLQPWTGRRHQLRIHLSHVAGCPILGDVAYGGHVNLNNAEDEEESNSNERSRGRDGGKVCRRMCLHAKELYIPSLIGDEIKTFVAPDPFVVANMKEKGDGEDNDGTLVIL